MLALTDGTGDKYKCFFSEEMGHLLSLFVWAFDLYLMSFEGYVMDWARGKDQVDMFSTCSLGGICFPFGQD
jgi:hypothetical protein